MDRRGLLRAASATVGVGLAGCAGLFGGSTPDYDVGMRASAYVPPDLAVPVGGTVRWYNNNDRPHTVTAYESGIPDEAAYFASGGYDSEAAARDAYESGLQGAIDPKDAYEHTFEVPGEYQYFCIPHERGGMVGVITVKESAGGEE